MENNNDFILTIRSGGYFGVLHDGEIPQYLRFKSKSLKRNWRIKLKGEKQQGFLKMNGKVAFNYFHDILGCKMQSVVDGVVVEEWEIEEFVMELRD